MANPYSLRSGDSHSNESKSQSQEANLEFNSPYQDYLDIRNEAWSKEFKFENRTAAYVYFPAIYSGDERVYLEFTTAIKKSKKSISWLLSMKYVITTNKQAFTQIYKWIKCAINHPDIAQCYSKSYTDRIVDTFSSTRVKINKDLPIGAVCLFTAAEQELKDACCDVFVIKQITQNEHDYQCCIQTTAVYLAYNVKIDYNATSYQKPPQQLRRLKWVNGLELQPLLSVAEIKDDNNFYRNIARYFGFKCSATQRLLNNYRALDKICCEQIFDALANELIRNLDEHSVGKTKRVGFIVALHSGKYSVPRFTRDQYSIQSNEWKKNANISTLICDESRHSLLYGADATLKVYSIVDIDGNVTKAFTICFQFSKLKIAEIDENRARVYVWAHTIKLLPNGIVVGKKEKIKRRNKSQNRNQHEIRNEEKQEDAEYNDRELQIQIN